MNTTTKKTNTIDVLDIKLGDIFSESSHYIFRGRREEGTGRNKKGINKFLHLASNTEIELGDPYVEHLLNSADQYSEEIKVGKEDKFWTAKQIEEYIKTAEGAKGTPPRVGDLRLKGIRTIWSEIYDSKVFTVCYIKADKKKAKKQLEAEKSAQLQEALSKLGSRNIVASVKSVIEKIQENPILDFIPGDERTLRGYKVQFSSVNGLYDVIDMDLPETDQNRRIRSVNVNEIIWLGIDGVKYIVE